MPETEKKKPVEEDSLKRQSPTFAAPHLHLLGALLRSCVSHIPSHVTLQRPYFFVGPVRVSGLGQNNFQLRAEREREREGRRPLFVRKSLVLTREGGRRASHRIFFCEEQTRAGWSPPFVSFDFGLEETSMQTSKLDSPTFNGWSDLNVKEPPIFLFC